MARADWRDQAQGFGLLSDPTRLGILAVLAKGTSNVTDLCKALKRKQPGVSHHLGLLRMGRLINGVRQGKAVVYAADKAALKALASALAALMPR
ncbi:MAG: winged helix-turn-helix transcriptional regulator [Acidobacteria bacterium]|nr:winged helix-turn-helix transcriptional regulator [Acidobacteriota bacterium]